MSLCACVIACVVLKPRLSSAQKMLAALCCCVKCWGARKKLYKYITAMWRKHLCARARVCVQNCSRCFCVCFNEAIATMCVPRCNSNRARVSTSALDQETGLQRFHTLLGFVRCTARSGTGTLCDKGGLAVRTRSDTVSLRMQLNVID